MTLKKRRKLNSLVYCIIDRGIVKRRSPEKLAKTLFAEGADILQLRYKNRPSLELVRIAKKIVKAAKKDKKIFLINDRFDAALASGSDGVHVGWGDPPVRLMRRLLPAKSIIGKTVHSLKQAKDARREDIDYVGAGPVFPTPIKKHLARKGTGFIKRIKKAVPRWVFAIGGINTANAMKVFEAGADGVCVIRASSDIGRMLKKLKARHL